jgi:hypothetical protein
LRPPDFEATVRWFQASVVAPHERGRRAPAPADRFVLPSRTLRPEQRMAIYADAYLARLVEALEKDFPAVARILGPRAFHERCRGYLERFPSRSRSLNSLGRRLPEVLSGAARDLARVEAAMSDVFDAEPAEPLRPSDFARIAPERLADARLDFVPAFRLLELDHAANPYIDAVRQERAAVPRLKHVRSWMAVYRKEFQVRRLDLKEPAFAALSALQRGRTVSQAVAAAARSWSDPPKWLQPQIRRWFGEWATEGFFLRLKR